MYFKQQINNAIQSLDVDSRTVIIRGCAENCTSEGIVEK